MALTLQFGTQMVGDFITVMEPLDEPLTPAEKIVGVWRDTAEHDTSSRNMEYSELIEVHLKRTDQLAMDATLAALRAMQGKRGQLTVRLNGVLRWQTSDQWLCDKVPPANLDPGFGGSVANLKILFCGNTPPARY